MKVSVIVPTYKDIVALELILEAFNYQTYKNFEVIVAEDDNSQETKEFLDSFKNNFELQHFSHEDIGSTTKPKAVNSAVAMSRGEYIIYIDGDTIPYSTFIEGHILLSKEKRALSGRRVNLCESISTQLRSGKMQAFDLEKSYFKYFLKLFRCKTRHIEKGFHLNPLGFIHKYILSSTKNVHLVGSNFSCWKSDILAINGSDEDMPPGAGTDDVDIEWRLEAIGVEIISCKYSANLFHLYHKRNDNREERTLKNQKIIAEKKKNNQFVCKNGIKTLS